MKITKVSIQAKNPDRVNVLVDGKYRFSLDVYQVGELVVKVGRDYSEQELVELEQESQFGKLYTRTVEYCLMRPHSDREVRDYLWRKTRDTKYKSRRTGEIKDKPGVSQALADRVHDRLLAKGYIDDEKFAHWWAENRNQTKGSSKRKLVNELRVKGVASTIIEDAISETGRSDEDELAKIIVKKRNRYPDEQKFMQYLARQGFGYDDIKKALSEQDSD